MADVTWYMSESAEAVAEELSRLLLSLEGRGDDEDVAEQYLDKFREIIDAHLPEGPVVGMEEGIAVIQAAVEKFVQARQNFNEGQACMQWLASSLATLCAQYVVDLNYQHLPVETKVKFVTTISMANELLQPFGHEDFLEVLLAARQPWPPVFLRILKGKASDMSEADVYLSREPSLLMEYRVRSLHGHGAVDDACTLAQYCMNHPSHGDVLFFREMFLLCLWQAGKLENIKRQVQFIECTKLYFIVQHFVAEGMLELAATVSTSYLIHQWKKGEYCCNKELVRQWCHIQHAVEDPSTTILESARTLAFKNDPKVLHLLYFAEALHKEVGKDSMPLVADLLLRAVDMDKPVTDPFFHPNATDDKTAYHHSAPTILSYMAVLLEGDYEIRCASQLTSFSISPDLDQYYVVEAVVNLPEEVQGTGVNLSRHKRRDILKTLRKLRPRSCGLHPEMSWQQLKPHMLKLLTSDERNELLQEHVEAECDTSAFEEIGKSPCKVTASKLRLTEKEPVCNVVESDEDDLTVLLSDSDEESCGPISPIYNGARYGLDFATPPRPPRASSIVDNVAKDSPFVAKEEVIVCEDGGSSPSYRAKWKQSECMEEPSVSQEGWLESVANGATGTVSMDKMVDTDDLMERIIKDQEEDVASSRNPSVLNNGFDADRHQECSSLQVEHSKEHPAGQGVRKLRKSLKHVTLQDLLWRTNPEDFDFTTNADEETVDVVSVLPADRACGEWQQPVDKEEQSYMNLECTETLDLDGSVQSVPSDVVRLDRMGKMHPKEEATLRGWEGFAPLEPLKNYSHSSNQNVEIVSRQSPEKGNQQGGFLDFTLSGDMVAENSSADLLKAKMANLVDQGGSCGSVFLVDLENCSAPDNTVAAAELTMAAQHGPQKPTDASAESQGATNGSNRNRITSRKNIFEAIGTVTNAAERPDRGSFLFPSSKGDIEMSKAKRRPSRQQALQKDPDVPNRSRNLPRRQDPHDFMQTVAPVHSLDPMSKNSWNSSASSLSSRGDTTSSHEGYDGSSEYSTETGEGMGSGPIQRPSKQEMMQRVRTFWTGFDFGQNDVTQGMDGMDDLISRTKKKAMQEPAELNNSSLGSRDKSNAPTPKPLQFNKLRQMLSERQTGQVTYTDQSGTTRLSEERTDKGSGTGNSPLKDRSERTIGVNTDDTHNTDLAYMMRTGDNFYSSSLSDSGSRISQATKDGAFGEGAKGLQENIMREELLRIPQPLLSTKKRRKDMIGVGLMSIQKCESYKCGCCTFQTKYLANIKRHMIKHGDHTMRYTKDISFLCQYCEYSRSTRKEVVAHMSSAHQHDSKISSLEPWTTDLPLRHAAAATFATKEDFFVGKEQISYDHQFLAGSREVFVPMPNLNDAKVNGTKSKIGTKKRKGKRPQNLAEIRKKTCAELAAKGIPHLQDTNSLRDSGIREEDSEGRTEERYWQADNPSLMMPIPSIRDGAASTGEVLTLRPTKQLPQTSFANFASPSIEEHLTLLLQPTRDSMFAVPRKTPEGSDPKLYGSASASTNEMPIFSHHSFSPPVRMSPMVSPPVMFIASPPTPLSPTANTSPPKKSSHVSPPRSKDENQNFATVKPASKRADKKDYKATFLYNLLTDKDEMKNVAMSQGTDPSNESRYSESQSVVPPLFQQGTEVPMIQTMPPASLLPQTAFAANIPNSYNFDTTFSPCQTGLQPTIGCYNVGSLPLVGSPPVYGRDEGLFVPADKKKRSRKGKSSKSRKQGTSIANAGTSPTFLKIPQKAQYSPLSHVPDSHASIPTFRPSSSQNKPGNRRWTHDQHSPYRSGLPDLTPYGDHGETLWQSQAYWWHSPQSGQNPAHARSKPPQTPRSAAWPKSHTVTTNEVQPLDLRTTPTIRSSPSANHYVGADNSTYGPPFGKSQRQPVENNGKVSSPMKIDQVSVSLYAQSEGCPPPTEDVQVQDSEEEGQSPATKPLTVPYIPIPEHYTVSKDITVKGGSRSTVTKGSGSYQTEEPTSMAATPGKVRETSSAGSVEQNETTGMTSGNAVEVKKVDSVDRQESSNLTLQMAASPNETKGIVSATCNNAGNEVVDGDSGALESHQYSKATGHIDGGPEDDTKEENVGELNTGKAPFDTEPAHIPLCSESESSVSTDKVLESNDKLFLYADNFSDDDIPVADATITANSCLTTKESVDADKALKAASEVETTQTPLTDNNPSVDDVIPSSEAQLTESHISNETSVTVEDRKTSADKVTVHRSLTTEDLSVDHPVVETDQTCKSESDHTAEDEARQTCKAEPEQTNDAEPVKTCKIEPDHACNGESLHTCKIEVEQAYDDESLQSCKAEPEHTCNVKPVHSCKTEPEHTYNIEPALPCVAELENTCSSLDIQDDTVSTIDQPVGDSSTDCKDAAIGNIQAVDVLKGKSSTSSESDSLCSASLPQGKSPATGKLTSSEPGPTAVDYKPSFLYAGHEQADVNKSGYRGPMTRKRMSTDAMQSRNNSAEQRKKLKVSQDETKASVDAKGDNKNKSQIPSKVSATPHEEEELSLPSLQSPERKKPMKGLVTSTQEKLVRTGKAHKRLQKRMSAGRKKGASPVSNKTTETVAISVDTLTFPSEEGLTSQQRQESVPGKQSVGISPCVKGSEDTKGTELLERDVSNDPCLTPQKKEKTYKRSPKRSSLGKTQVADVPLPPSKQELSAVELVTEEAASLQKLGASSPSKTNPEPFESKGDLQSLAVFSHNNLVPNENAKRSQKRGRSTGRRGRADVQRSYPKETTTALTSKQPGSNASEEDSSTSVDRKDEDSKGEISSLLGNCVRNSTSLKSKTKPLLPCTDEDATSEPSKSKGSSQKSWSTKQGRKEKAVKSQQKSRHVDEKKLDYFLMPSSEEKPNPGSAYEFANETSEDDALTQDKSLGRGDHKKEKAPPVQGRTVRRRVKSQRVRQNISSSAEEDTGSEVAKSDQSVSKPTTHVKSEMTKQTVKRQQKRSAGRRKVTVSKLSSPGTISTTVDDQDGKDSQEPTSPEPVSVSACCDEFSNLTDSTGAGTAALDSSPETDTSSSNTSSTLEGKKSQMKNRSNYLVIQKSGKAAEAPRRSDRKRVPTCKILGKTVVVYTKRKSDTSEGSSREESDHDSLLSFNPTNTGWTYSREDKKRYQKKSAVTEESEEKGTETIDPTSSESAELETPILKEENMNPVGDNISIECAPHTSPSKTRVAEKDTTLRRLRSRSPTITIATGETKANMVDPSLMEEVPVGPSSLTSKKTMATRRRRNRSDEDETSKVLLPEESSPPVAGGTKRKTSNKDPTSPPVDSRKVAGTVVNSASGQATVKGSKSKQHCVSIPASGKKSRNNQTSGNKKSEKKPNPSSATRSTGVKTKVVRKGKQDAAPGRKTSAGAGTGVPTRLLVTKGKVSPKGSRPKKK
ncbi:ZNF292 [Branchiostoma lanceolatum]|uniref:ZNF292 protein n=1 Tax=Branchiostoma lanceolatum TaxID=7740 RepID=A0A8J9ZMT0_BRALA|nr:ZNF292 [Branchiostoma lanceolatum]